MAAYVSIHGTQRDRSFQMTNPATPAPATTARISINVLSISPPELHHGHPVRPLPKNTFRM
jgi:hypothetical protein